jgi:2'-5' RNA ligase
MDVPLIFPLRRMFLALPLEGEAKQLFRQLQDRIQDYARMLTFQSAETPHITLQYWDAVMQIEYGPILEQAQKIANATTQFPLKLEGIDTFGHRGRERTLFLSVPFSEDLARLKKRCPWPSVNREETDSAVTSFHPHATLARIKHADRFTIDRKKILKALGEPAVLLQADRLRLYAEIDGVKQTPIRDFIFTGS